MFDDLEDILGPLPAADRREPDRRPQTRHPKTVPGAEIPFGDPSLRFLRVPRVLEMTGMTRSTLYRRMSEGEFPRQRKNGDTVYWIEAEVREWQARQLMTPHVD